MEEEKTFYEHIEDLRKAIIKSIIVVIILSIAAYFFKNEILEILVKPLGKELIFLSPSEAFVTLLRLSIITGAVVSFPYISYEAWKFISVAFNKESRGRVVKYALISLILFYGAIIACYLFLLPIVLKFLMNFGGNLLVPTLTAENYINFVVVLLISFGLIFQFPVVLMILLNLNLISVKTLTEKRAYFIVAIFIFAALLPPPDAISQIAIALPMILFFEIVVLIAKIKSRKRGDN